MNRTLQLRSVVYVSLCYLCLFTAQICCLHVPVLHVFVYSSDLLFTFPCVTCVCLQLRSVVYVYLCYLCLFSQSDSRRGTDGHLCRTHDVVVVWSSVCVLVCVCAYFSACICVGRINKMAVDLITGVCVCVWCW